MKVLSIVLSALAFVPTMAMAAAETNTEKFDCSLMHSHATADDKFGLGAYQQSPVDRQSGKPNVLSLKSHGYDCEATLDTAALTWKVVLTGPGNVTKTDSEAITPDLHAAAVLVNLPNGDEGVCECDAYALNFTAPNAQ